MLLLLRTRSLPAQSSHQFSNRPKDAAMMHDSRHDHHHLPFLAWWRGVAVTRFIRFTKLLYVRPG